MGFRSKLIRNGRNYGRQRHDFDDDLIVFDHNPIISSRNPIIFGRNLVENGLNFDSPALRIGGAGKLIFGRR